MKFTFNRKDKLVNITLSYSFIERNETKKFGYIIIYTLLFLILIIFLWFYFLVFLFNIYVLYQILYNIVDTTVFINENEYEIYITNFQSNYNNKLNTNYLDRFIELFKSNYLDRFIELFKSNSSIKYFPNYFVDVPSFNKYDKEIVYNLEPLYYNINNQRLNRINELESLVNEMYYCIKQYKSTVDWILNNHNNNLCY